ncbi:MAG: tripartite tricarboxylate transporter substrate binding protein [Hyphomicrobiales bacterium]|nr:tripartite tricarboxylate transporter substrate binding protein [Hyphomicrobiales bacterium]
MAQATRALLFAALLLPIATVTGTAHAQTYPSKPVRLLLPYNPGGIIDFVGRTVAQRLGPALGQTVVAENRPGAGGMTGTSAAARSAPDGYTLLLMDPAVVINPTLQRDVPYKLEELRPVSVVGASPLMMVVSGKTETTSVAEFLKYAAQRKGKLNYSSAGIGTTPHLAGELFNIRTQLDATHIPYRGSGPSVPDMMAGKIHFSFNTFVVAAPFLSDNRLRVIGAAGPKRIAAAPDVPTMSEAGMPGFEVNLWVAIFVPAATPDPIVQRLYEALKETLADSELRASFAKVGVEPDGQTPAASAAMVKAEYQRWGDLIRKANIKPE